MDLDPCKNVTDPQHCSSLSIIDEENVEVLKTIVHSKRQVHQKTLKNYVKQRRGLA